MKRFISLLKKVLSVILRRKPKDTATNYRFFAMFRMMKRNRKSISLTAVGLCLGLSLVYVFLLKGSGAAAAWWNDGWKYRKNISISNSATSLTDYQLKVSLDTAALITGGKMQTDCDDIRVVDHSGRSYNFWIEPNTCNTASTIIWTKIPELPSAGAELYVYYGNELATSASKTTADIFMQEIDNVGAAWLLDESSANSCTGGVNDSCDSSSNNFDLAWGTATTSTTGKISNGLQFDGTDTATANIDDTFTPISSTKRWTVALWFKTSDTQGYLFDTGDGANSGERVAVFSDGVNNLSLYMSQDSNGTEYKYLNYSVTSTDNNWHHLVVTRDGDNSVKLYVDGSVISVSSTTTDVDMSAYSETWTDFVLGHRYALNIYNYSGIIDEARVYSDSLTASEISALYGNGTNRYGYVTANYANKELISQYSSNVSVGSPASEEVGPGPAGYWKFDEGYGTNVNDSSGSNHTGNLGTGSSAPTWRTGESCVNGNCLQLDGTDDSINFGDILDFTGNTEMTVSAWIKLTSTPSSRGQIISKYDAGTSGQWYFGVDSQKKVVFLRECGSYGITGNNALSLSTWNHVSGVYDGTNLNIYVNGILDKTAVDSCSISNTSVDTVIGAGDNGTGTEDQFQGFIDEVKVYPYGRTADEIKQDYLFSSAQGASVVLGASNASFLSNGLVGYWKMDETTGTTGPSWTATDSSGSGKNGTGAGNAVVTSGKFGNGGGLDGSGDYLDMGDQTEHDLTFPFTLSAWINISQLPSDKGSDSEIMSKYGGSGTRQWTLSIGTDNVLYFFKSHNGTNGEYGVVSGHEFTSADVNVWRHVSYSVDVQGNANMYIDGALIESYTFSNTTIYTGASTTMRIGARALNSNYFKGTIDEARIYNRALTSSEVKSLYQWAPGPITYWRLDEGSGDTAYDISGNGNDGTLQSSMTDANWGSGKYGKAVSFNDSQSQYARNAVSGGVDGLSHFTASAWARTNDWSDCGECIFFDFGAGTGLGGLRYLSGSGKFQSDIIIGGTTYYFGTGTNSVPNDSDWHYYTMTYDSSTIKFYVDGTLTNSQTGVSGLVEGRSGISIGSSITLSRYFGGDVDDVRIYNYARTQSQILEDMNAGHPAVGTPVGSTVLHLRMDEGYGTTANDSSPQGNNGTLGTGSSAPSWTNDGKYGKALSFDGSNDYVEVGSPLSTISNSTTKTVSAWVKTNTVSGTKRVLTIYKAAGSSSFSIFKYNNYWYGGYRSTSDSWTIWSSGQLVIANTWTHLLFLQDGSTVQYYINGELTNSASNAGQTTLSSPPNASIGMYNSGEFFDGIIDEVKVYPFALTAEQVKLDYHGGKMMVLGAQNTDVGGTSPSNSAGREYCVPGDTTSCTGPVLELNFDENTGTTVNDTSTNGNNGSLINGPKWRQNSVCTNGTCLEFDGSSNYVSLSDSTSLDYNAMSAATVSVWAKANTVTATDKTVYGHWYGGANRRTFSINHQSGNKWECRTNDGNGSAISTTSVSAGQWYHVSCVWEASTSLKIYVNGKLEATDSTVEATLDSNSAIHTIGVREKEGVFDQYFNGYVDSLRVYGYARTPAQIAWDMNKGSPIVQYRFDECQGTTVHDVTGNGYDATMSIGGSGTSAAGTCNTSSSAWGNGATGKWNASLDLDGSDDYLATGSTVPELAGLTEMSVCSWIKYGPGSVTGDGVIVGQYAGAPPGWLMWVDDVGAVFGETDTVSFSPNPGGSTAGRVEGTSGLVTSGTWDHYCGVFKGGNFIRLYKNGVLNAENTSSISATADTSDAVLQMGRWTGGAYFDGQIDDVRIYNYALTGHQIKEVYAGGAVSFK